MRVKGERLREERIRRGLTVEEVAQAIRIRPRFVRAMEEGRAEELPPGVIGKGFVRAYARYLGIRPEEILEEDVVTESLTPKRAVPLWPFLAAGALALVVLLWLWGGGEGERGVEPPVPTEAVAPGPPSLNLTAPREEAPPSEIEVPKVHLLEMEATDLTWIEIRKGDEPPYDITLYPGDRYRVKDPRGFTLKIGNAAGVRITFDGKELGRLGEKGQVVTIRLP